MLLCHLPEGYLCKRLFQRDFAMPIFPRHKHGERRRSTRITHNVYPADISLMRTELGLGSWHDPAPIPQYTSLGTGYDSP